MVREIRNEALNIRIKPSDKELIKELAGKLGESQTSIVVTAVRALAWSQGMGDNEKGDSSCD